MWNRLFSLSFAKIKDNLHLSLFFRYKVTMQRGHSPMERTMGVYRQDFYRELAHRHPPSPLLSNSNVLPLFAPCACPYRPFPCAGGAVEAVFAINLHVITFGWVVLLRPSLPLCLCHVPCPYRPFPCDGGAMADGDTTNPLGVVLSIARGCRR